MTTREAARIAERDMDKRVRERNLASGRIEAKAVERMLTELPDLEPQCEMVLLEQPAVSGEADDDEP
jgi:hypothetical protein